MKAIGRSELFTSPLTLGTMTWGAPVGEEEAIRLTRYALERGINHIDTANMYEGYNRAPGSAGGVAEEIVGKAIRGFPRDQILLATKVGMKVGAAPEDEGTSALAIRTQLDRSLHRMKTDYVDLYYLHRYDPTVSPEEILDALTAAKKEGKLRYWGISNYSAAEAAALLAAADKAGLERPVICQPPLSLIKQEAAEALLPLCEKEGIAAVPYQIFQGGLLTGKYRRGNAHPESSRAAQKPSWMMTMDDALYDRLEEYEATARSEGLSLPAYALRWVLTRPAVVSALIGVRTRRQIDEALLMLEAIG